MSDRIYELFSHITFRNLIDTIYHLSDNLITVKSLIFPEVMLYLSKYPLNRIKIW